MKSILYFLTVSLLLIATTSAKSQNPDYYISKNVNLSFEEASKAIIESLKEQKFGVITEIDMHEKLAEKIPDVDIKRYRILGVCNPKYAYQTLKVEENIGLFLPCKVLVKEIDDNNSEIVLVNPTVMMEMLGNKELIPVADKVTKHFKLALENL